MTTETPGASDPRSFLYRGDLTPDAAQALTAQVLGKADDGELYLQYRLLRNCTLAKYQQDVLGS